MLRGDNRNSLLAAVIAVLGCYFFVYAQTINLFSIDDFNGLSPYRSGDDYTQNLLRKGRYFAHLTYEFFQIFGISVYSAYSFFLAGTLVAIGACVHLFSRIVRVDSFWLTLFLTVFVVLSPQNFELMHFRHAVLIYFGTYAGTALLLYAYLKKKPVYWYVLAGVFMLGGYTASLPILLTLLGFFVVFDLQRAQANTGNEESDKVVSWLFKRGLYYFAILVSIVILHAIISTVLIKLYNVRGGDGFVSSFAELMNTWEILSRRTKALFSGRGYSNVSLFFHFSLFLACGAAMLFSVKTKMAKFFVVILFGLIFLVAFFNVYVIFIKLRYFPPRAFLHIQMLTAFFALTTYALLKVRWASVIVSGATGFVALIYSLTMINASNAIVLLRQQDEVIGTAVVNEMSKYDVPPPLHISHDARSIRSRARHSQVFGGIRTLMWAPWSKYAYISYLGLGDSLETVSDPTKVKELDAICRARSKENFAYKIESSKNLIHVCT